MNLMNYLKSVLEQYWVTYMAGGVFLLSFFGLILSRNNPIDNDAMLRQDDYMKTYTVIMIQIVKGTRYLIGTKAMDQINLNQLLASGATLFSRDAKRSNIITVCLN